MKNRLNETKEERIRGLLGMEKWKGGQIEREREERTASDTKISRWNVKLGASSRHIVTQDIIAMTTFKEVFTML